MEERGAEYELKYTFLVVYFFESNKLDDRNCQFFDKPQV